MRNLKIISCTAIFLLVSSIFWTYTLVDAKCKPTSGDILGPYYVRNVRQYRKFCTSESSVKDADRLVVRGRVISEDCRPLGRRRIDMWQANPSGRYIFQDCRGYVYTNGNGYYQFTTIHPGKYPIDRNRQRYRPAHLHFKVFGGLRHNDLVTQMYFAGDSHLGRNDSCRVCSSGQRDLVVRPRFYCDNPDIPGRCTEVAEFDIVLSRRRLRFQRLFQELVILDRVLGSLSNNMNSKTSGRAINPQSNTNGTNVQNLKSKEEPMQFSKSDGVSTSRDPNIKTRIVSLVSPNNIEPNKHLRSMEQSQMNMEGESGPLTFNRITDNKGANINRMNVGNKEQNNLQNSIMIRKTKVGNQSLLSIDKNGKSFKSDADVKNFENSNAPISIDSLVNSVAIRDNMSKKTEFNEKSNLQNEAQNLPLTKFVKKEANLADLKPTSRTAINIATETRKNRIRKSAADNVSLRLFLSSVFRKMKSGRASI